MGLVTKTAKGAFEMGNIHKSILATKACKTRKRNLFCAFLCLFTANLSGKHWLQRLVDVIGHNLLAIDVRMDAVGLV